MSKWSIVAFVLVLAIAQVAAQQPAQPAVSASATKDGPDDVHVHVAKVAESKATGNTLIGIENKFALSHSRVMSRLNAVLKRVTAHISPKSPSLMETEEQILPIVDNTGSHASVTPTANLTKYSVKPKIDQFFLRDAFVQTEEAVKPTIDGTGSWSHTPRANITKFSVKPKIDAALVKDFASLLETEILVAPILDNTGGDSFTPKANLSRFSVKPKIIATLVKDSFLELETEVEAEAEEEEEFLETEGVVIPTIDGTGSHASVTPTANLTKYSVKPKIDQFFLRDAFVQTEEAVKPTIDGTGSWSHTPRANITKFSVKPKIDAALVKDAAIARSLLETSSRDCPGCRNRGIKQNLEIVLSPIGAPSAMDKPLIEAQHNAVNYLLPKAVKQSMSISQSHLDSAQSAVVEAAGSHERFADFTDKHRDTPLIPQL